MTSETPGTRVVESGKHHLVPVTAPIWGGRAHKSRPSVITVPGGRAFEGGRCPRKTCADRHQARMSCAAARRIPRSNRHVLWGLNRSVDATVAGTRVAHLIERHDGLVSRTRAKSGMAGPHRVRYD
jgi:hypothetical protein